MNIKLTQTLPKTHTQKILKKIYINLIKKMY